MRPPTPLTESRIAELEEFRKARWQGLEFQRYLCVWMRVKQGATTGEIAKAVGWHVNTVRHVQKDFADRGTAALVDGKRGGRMRQCMSPGEEAEFLEGFRAAAGKGRVLVAGEIRAALEARLGRKVSLSTAYRLLRRNRWRKVVPRPRHPKKDAEAGEAFKKGASRKGWPRRG